MDSASEYLFKLLLIGDAGTGKTSLARRAVHGIFYSGTRPTVGVDFAIKAITHKGASVTIQIWDISGSERFRNMTRTFYQNAVGACVVVDVMNKATLDAAALWKQDVDAKVFVPGTNTPLPCLLLLNKSDLGDGEVGTPAEIDEFCKKHKFVGWAKTSAQSGEGVSEALEKIVDNMIEVTSGAKEASAAAGGAAAPTSVNKINMKDAPAAKPADQGKKCDC